MRVTTRNVTLVGTAHVSQRSVDEVRQTILQLQPEIVCVELDETRLRALQDPHAWAQVPVLDLIREGKGPQLLAQIVLGSFQRRIGKETGVRPGEELLTAVDAAKQTDAEIVLADREVGITLRRAFQSMPFTEKTRVGWEIFKAALLPADDAELDADTVDELLEEDALTAAMEELADLAPSASHVLIDERDAYMATRILDARDSLPPEDPQPDAELEPEPERDLEPDIEPEAPRGEAPAPPSPPEEPVPEEDPEEEAELDPAVEHAIDEGGDVVAILGAGHLRGVQDRIEGEARVDTEELTRDASSGIPWGKTLAWGLAVAVVGLFAYLGYQGFQTGDFSGLASGAAWYLLFSGTLAALGCFIAGGHPFAIGTAFLASPLTSLHPAVAAGWFAGGVEAWKREPRVGDIEGLSEIYSFRDMRENNLVRVILVAALTNLGSILGSWAGFAALFEAADLLGVLIG